MVETTKKPTPGAVAAGKPPVKTTAAAAGSEVRGNGHKSNVDVSSLKLRRDLPRRPDEDEEVDEEEQSLPVSAGPLERVIEYAFNPSKDRLREVTIIDRMQGHLLPLVDVTNTLYRYCIEVATFRSSKEHYKVVYKRPRPVQPDMLEHLVRRIAQWQKSIAGKNLEKASDIAMAEIETKGDTTDTGETGNRGYTE